MKTLDIRQTTVINISFLEGVTEERAEVIAETISEQIYVKLDNKKHHLECEYRKGSDGDYKIIYTEEGSIDYYPSNDWYEPDDYDEPTTLNEYDFEDAIEKIRKEETTDLYEMEVDSVGVYKSEWEELI